ncbi:aspartate aminotransferase family protein [Nonlabens xiamenensis]|uniref:aspartate aminotransferase family protein n=1 Tax=Nonlabens xiamenensis TaxID=2341043 RepID=UPI000F6084D1|nr:aspartate aminotransferase family protein [Nonlabens xiamenensis]
MSEAFKRFQAPTSPFAPGIEISHAFGNYIYDKQGNTYLDMVAGVSALPLGHCHPKVVDAIKTQVDKYMHVMVYGEYALDPAIQLCKLLAHLMPDPLEMTYLVNSGTEAIEASLKLARRVTGRSTIIAMKNAYHGNTMGSLSLMDYEERKAVFRPLVPDIYHIKYNCLAELNRIDKDTAAVIIESIQGGAGFLVPSVAWIKALRNRCDDTGTLLIVDEIQPGIGRTGTMFYFEQWGIVPDMVITGKGLAGGMPIGALTASREHLSTFKESPMLGHITTFGGNPVIAAAALKTLQEICEGNYMEQMHEKEVRFRESLDSPYIQEIRGKGLMLAVILPDDKFTSDIVNACREEGVLFFLLLYEKRAIRITPPYTITNAEIDKACQVLVKVIEKFYATN